CRPGGERKCRQESGRRASVKLADQEDGRIGRGVSNRVFPKMKSCDAFRGNTKGTGRKPPAGTRRDGRCQTKPKTMALTKMKAEPIARLPTTQRPVRRSRRRGSAEFQMIRSSRF